MDNENGQSLPPTDLSLLFDGKELKYLKFKSLDFGFVINRIPAGTVVMYRPDTTVGDRSGEVADAGLCLPGSEIEIKTGLNNILFRGVVVEQNLHWTKDGGVDIALKFRHKLHQLTLVHRSQVFGVDKVITDAEIVRGLLAQHGIAVTAMTGMMVAHEQMVQYQCTDWCFLKTRLSANDVWLLPTAAGANVTEPSLVAKPDHVLNLSPDNTASVWTDEVDWTFSADEQAAAVKVSSWNLQQQNMAPEATGRLGKPIGTNGLDPAAQKTLLGQPWALLHSVTMPSDEQTALANGRLLAQYGAAVRGKFRLYGTTEFEIGQTVEIKGLGGHFSGTALISGVSHEMEQGSWRTTITVGQELCCGLDAAVVPGISGLHVGVVAPYKPDVRSWNRLRVFVPGMGLGNHQLWARFAAPYASKSSGVCFYPEPGDEVVLGFFESDPRYPVVLGAMHNPLNKAPFPPEKSLGKKGMIFEQAGQPQNSLSLLFKLTEKEVALQSGQHQMSFDAKGIGLVTDSPQPISLTSKTGIKLDGGTEVAIKGKKIDLTN